MKTQGSFSSFFGIMLKYLIHGIFFFCEPHTVLPSASCLNVQSKCVGLYCMIGLECHKHYYLFTVCTHRWLDTLFWWVQLGDTWPEHSKSWNKVWPLIEHEYCSQVWVLLMMHHKGVFFVCLKRCILRVKTKLDINYLFLVACHFTDLRWSQNTVITNSLKYQLHENTSFCYSNTHHTHLQYI